MKEYRARIVDKTKLVKCSQECVESREGYCTKPEEIVISSKTIECASTTRWLEKIDNPEDIMRSMHEDSFYYPDDEDHDDD